MQKILTDFIVLLRVAALPTALLIYDQPALANQATDCFKKAWAHPDDGGFGMPRGLATELCKGAQSAPAVTACYEKAWGNPDNGGLGLPRGLAVSLCTGAVNAAEVTQCYEKAWRHPGNGGLGMTRGGAVELCAVPKQR